MIHTYQEAQLVIARNPNIFDGLMNASEFDDWLRDNMHIVIAFQRYAIDLRNRGHRDRYSARPIWERIRWDSFLSEQADEYKLNNNPMPYVARLAMAANSSLRGMFAIRDGRSSS